MSATRAAALVAIFLAAGGGALLVLSVAGPDRVSPLTATAGVGLIALLALLAGARWLGVSRAALGLRLPPNRRDWLLVPICVPIMMLAVAVFGPAGERLFGTPDVLSQSVQAIADDPHLPLWAVALIVVAVVPLVEEVLFRGVVQGGLVAVIGFGPAILVAAFLFGLAHAYASAYIVAVIPVGIVLGWLYARTQSLGPPIAAHALNNAVVLIGLQMMAG